MKLIAVISILVPLTQCLDTSNIAKPGQFPYMVLVVQNKYACGGGAILSERWVITAASCASVTSDLEIVTNSTKLAEGDFYSVDTVFTHPDYAESMKRFDLALLRTSKPIEMSSMIQPIKINSEFLLPNTIVQFAGWGSQYGMRAYLGFGSFEIMLNSHCDKLFEGHPRIKPRNEEVCTFPQEEQGTCNLDQGGPLILNGALVGIRPGRGCFYSYPNIFIRLSEVYSWIEDVINEK